MIREREPVDKSHQREFSQQTMTHFRGQIRGPHWGPTMDNLLIEFWRKHDCLFNSSVDSYYDRDLKSKLWREFAVSVGKPVSDVERRSRSLRTQYGRVLWHPEKVGTAQQKMLREKLDFLRPYIVRRRNDSYLEEKFDDREEDDEELETEGSIDQEMGCSFGSPLDDDLTGQDLDDEPTSVASTQSPAPLYCPNPQPQVTDVMSLSCPHHHNDQGSADQPDQTANTSKHDILKQFAEVLLADMRHIKDPVVLMRLRRDITNLVFRAVEEDMQARCVRVPSVPRLGESCHRPQQAFPQTNYSWRQSFFKRKNTACETGKRMQRWEETKHVRRTSRSQLSQPVQPGQAMEGENSSQVIIQASDIKKETELPFVKTEEETLQLA